MKLDKKVNTDKVCKKMEGMSGAEIKAVVTEAGYFAIRKNRTRVIEKDLLDGVNKVKQEEQRDGGQYLHMFG